MWIVREVEEGVDMVGIHRLDGDGIDRMYFSRTVWMHVLVILTTSR